MTDVEKGSRFEHLGRGRSLAMVLTYLAAVLGGPPLAAAAIVVPLVYLLAADGLRAEDITKWFASWQNNITLQFISATMVQWVELIWVLFVTGLLCQRLHGVTLEDLGLGRLPVDRHLLLLLLVGVGLHATEGAVTVVTHARLPASWLPLSTSLVVSLMAVLLNIPVALSEELTFRGYVWRVLEANWGTRFAFLVSSFIFASLHFLNRPFHLIWGVGLFSTGLLLGYAYMRTRVLWSSVVLHFGMNLGLYAVSLPYLETLSANSELVDAMVSDAPSQLLVALAFGLLGFVAVYLATRSVAPKSA